MLASLLLIIILIVYWATRDRRSGKENKQPETFSLPQLSREQLSRINYLLAEIESWQLKGLVDRELALKLSQQYREQRNKLLGLAPTNDPIVAKPALHTSSETLPDSLLDTGLQHPGQKPLTAKPSTEILPEKIVEKSKQRFDLLNFLQEKNIKWFNALGTVMLLAAGIIFVATNWESWNGLIKSMLMVLVTGLFFGGGYFIREKLELPTSGLAFYLVGSFFIPLTFVSFNNFGLFGATFDWAGYAAFTALLCMFVYGFMTYKLQSQIFAGLTPVAGGVALFSLLSYYNLPNEKIGFFFVPLSLIYFLAYYYLRQQYPEYRQTLLPLPVAANACAALGLGLAGVDFGLGLFVTAIIAAGVYLLSTYLFRQLEYLYVSIGVMILSVFPGVGYFHLPNRSYNLSFIGIAAISLGLSYINRRLNNPKFERHFFYTMLGSTCLAAGFLFINGLHLFFIPLKFNPNLFSSMITLVGATIIYLLSARLYNSPRYTYVAMVALFTAYAMGLIWLGISAKLYAVFFLVLSAALIFLSKVIRDYKILGKPVYLSGIAGNALVSVLLVMLIGSNPQILTKLDSNLLAGIIALLLNSLLYLYLAYDTRLITYSSVGNCVFAAAYLLFSVYLGIGQWKWGLYLNSLTVLFLLGEYILAKYPLYAKPCKYFAWGTMYIPVLYYLALFANQFNTFVTSSEWIFRSFAPGMMPVLLALTIVAAGSIYLVVRFSRIGFTYMATALTILTAALLLNWLGLEPSYLVSLLMLLPIVYLLLHKLFSQHALFSEPLEFSGIGANILLTLLLVAFGRKVDLSMYLALSLSLMLNSATYFFLASKWKNPVFTWGGIIPSFITYIHLLDYLRPQLDPHLYYLGLDLMCFALVSVITGVILFKREQPYYFRPLLMFGYGLSTLAIGFGFTCGDTLLYPAILGTLLYGITAYRLTVYKQSFWRAALLAANISFAAVLFKLNPDYGILDYVRYFLVFNLLKLALAVYLQYFENNRSFAWSTYIGIAFTSLLSLALTLLYRDWAAAALVWSVYGMVYFALAYLLELEAAVYVGAAVISTGFGFMCHTFGVSNKDLGLYLSVLSFVWLGLSILLRDFAVYRKPLSYLIPVSIGLCYLLNLITGVNQALLGSLIAAVAMFIHRWLGGISLYNYLTPLALISGYEAFLLKYHVHFQELYLAPVSLYLIVVSFFLRKYHQKLNYLSYAGLLMFVLDAYVQSFTGRDFLLHALVLGLVATASILIGVALKHRGFFFLGIIFLLGDVTTQSRSFLGSLQKWFWIGLGGIMFLGLGLLFDKKRKDHTLKLLNQQLGRFKGWS